MMIVNICALLAVAVLVGAQNPSPLPPPEMKDSCRHVVYNYSVQNLHQTNYPCCQNATVPSQGGAIEDLKSQVAALQAKIQVLERNYKGMEKKKVAFYVKKTGPHQTLRSTVVFETVVTQQGLLWQASTNSFQLQVKGMYVLHFSVMTADAARLDAAIMRNSEVIQHVYAPPGQYKTTTATAVVELNSGDLISCKLMTGKLYGTPDYEWVHFSGFLLY